MPATEPAELHDLFTAAVNSKDADALVALYEPTGTAVHLDGSTCTGEPALKARGVTVTSDGGARVKWCAGMRGTVPVLKVANARGTDPDEHFHELRTGDGKERNASLAGDFQVRACTLGIVELP